MSNWKLPNNLKRPECDGKAEAATGIDPKAFPHPGDISICAYCSSINRYRDAGNGYLSLGPVSEKQLIELKKQQPETYNEIMICKAAIKMTMTD